MRIDVYPSLLGLEPTRLEGRTAIAIDVLRATSVIVTALANGAEAVLPALTPEEAREVAAGLPPGRFLLAGERESRLIPGFDLANSPREYTAGRVAGRVIVLTTTNGTRAIRACEPASAVLVGSFLNAGAVARAAAGEQKPVAIVCAATRGEFDLGDVAAAGAIVAGIRRGFAPGAEPELNDLARAAHDLFDLHRKRLGELLAGTRHGGGLERLGLGGDLPRCAALDSRPVVPWYRQGRITLVP